MSMKLTLNEIFISGNIRTPLDFKPKANTRFRRISEKMPKDHVKTMIRGNNKIAKREMKECKAKQNE